MKDKKIRELAVKTHFTFFEIKDFAGKFNTIADDEIESMVITCFRCNTKLGELIIILDGFEEKPTLKNYITKEIFFNKELSDYLRDIVVNSPVTLENAIKLMKGSKDYERDALLIKELSNMGCAVNVIRLYIDSENISIDDKINEIVKKFKLKDLVFKEPKPKKEDINLRWLETVNYLPESDSFEKILQQRIKGVDGKYKWANVGTV